MAYRSYESPPTWYQDGKWLSGLLLVPVLMALLLMVTLTQLSSPGPGRAVLQKALALALFPDGLEAATLSAVELPTQLSPGESLELVTGVAVFAAADEIGGLTPEGARLRVAGALADLILREGLQGTLTRVANPQLAQQLSADFVSDLSRTHLEAALLPAGLADGSRLADWRQQRANRPGQPVQPIVGVFVVVEPAELEPLTNRDIGVLVVRRLNEVLLTQGLPAAQALVGNANLLQRLNDTAQGEIRQALGAFLATTLIAEEPAIARRLTQAREAAAQEATAAPVPWWLGPELADLPPAEANALVLQRVSEAIYYRSLTEALATITEPDARLRIGAALEPFSAFTASQHGHWLRLSWLLGAPALLLGGLLVFFSNGLSRLINLGLVLLMAAVPGTLLFAALEQALAQSAAPTLPHVEGTLVSLTALARYLMLNIPDDVAAIALRNHLVAVMLGAGLVLLPLAVWLVMTFRLRRRRF